jgi:hypothetical protein
MTNTMETGILSSSRRLNRALFCRGLFPAIPIAVFVPNFRNTRIVGQLTRQKSG